MTDTCLLYTSKQFKSINSKVEEMIHTARADGNAEQDAKILEAIKDGFTPNMPAGESTGEFFKVNDRKLDALVKSTTRGFLEHHQSVCRHWRLSTRMATA